MTSFSSEEAARLRPLVDPRSIAVYGASADLTRLGGMPVALLTERGFQGAIYPINPKYTEIAGLRCYPDIASLPVPADLIVIAVAAPEVVGVMRQAAARGIRAAVVFAAGFAEANDVEGLALQAELVEVARELGIVVAGPNCMGFGNLDSHAYSTFTAIFRTVEPPAEPRDTGLVTQSGSICSAIYAAGRQLGVRFNVVINTGNEACVEFSEYLEYLADRPGTETIVGYIEGLRDGARFERVATRLRDEGRLLALLKAGETEKGALAAASHTAALAGSGAVYRAMFERLCVVPAHDILHAADVAYLGRFRQRASGSRVAVLTISGAIGALLADAFTQSGIDLPELSAPVREALREGIPRFGMVHNPVDFTGNIVNRHQFAAQALETLFASGEVDFAVIYAPGFLIDRMSEGLAAVSKVSGRLVAAISTGKVASREMLEAAGVPVFDDTTRAVRALASLAHWHENRRRHVGRLRTTRPANLEVVAREIVSEARRDGEQTIDEHRAKRLMAEFGLPVARERVALTAPTAVEAAQAIGYPVVLKVLSADIAHKSDIGGVRLNLIDDGAVQTAFTSVLQSVTDRQPQARVTGVLVQKQEAAGTELLVGVVRDPVFGLMMTLGMGGVWTEVFGDVVHAPLPVTEEIATVLVRRLKGWPLLEGLRGSEQVNMTLLVKAIACVSDAACALGGDLDELEINPLIARADGVVAVDALVRLSLLPATVETVASLNETAAGQPA
ncbi:acetate--CoA ligase family protein [Ottowia thiooxydans]|uniref:Acyl-CoA synthetase (NDP forming) n=1 Tax=Ottowia thiooxydans TaxID=219182 RepID=A0ABV2Q3K2_9BURK